MVVCFACVAVFLAVFDPLTSFNHGLQTVTSAQDPVLLCVFFVCVCHPSNKRSHMDTLKTHFRITS